MVRFARLASILAAFVLTIAGVLGAARIANAAPPPIDVRGAKPVDQPIAQPPNGPLRPHLPFDAATPTPSPSDAAHPSSHVAGSAVTWVQNNALRPPPYMPKLSKFLVKTGAHTMGVRPMIQPMGLQRLMGTRSTLQSTTIRPMAADGSTIILSGDQSNYFENDLTLSYGANVYLSCENMPTGVNYRYVVWSPDGKGFQSSGNVAVNGSGACNSYGAFNLSTPFQGVNNGTVGTVSTDPAYSGVWILAMQNVSTGAYVTETALVATSTVNFTTYSDIGLANQSNDFNAGSYMVVNATGLNTAHSYALGWVFTGGNGMPCDYSIPSVGAGKSGVCFTGAATGVQAFGGGITQWWGPTNSPSSSTARTGTYDIELYDTTTQDMISHQQISVQPNTTSWTLTPYDAGGATPPPGLNYNNTFATDGLTDQSVTGLTYAASGLPAASNGHTIRLAISNPNGVILTGNSSFPIPNPPTILAPPTTAQAAGAISKQVAFPYDLTYQTAYGPTTNPFAPNVLTAQLYDTTLGTILGSKSFQLLAYSANFTWNGASYVNAAPGTGQTQLVTVTNTGGQNYGTWNGDGINGIIISHDPAYNEQLNIVATTATDSAGNAWTITQVGSGTNATIVATSNNPAVGIPIGGTLSFNIGIQIANGQCASSPCYFDTQIRPIHGIAYSGTNKVSNGLGVVAQGVPPSTVVSTGSWAVQSEASTANMAARAPTFAHLTYVMGTANSPSSDTYNINLTFNNVSSPGGHKIMDVKMVFPGAVDLNSVPPAVVSSPAGTGTWSIATNSNIPTLGGANVIVLQCRPTSRDQCGITQGSSGTFTLQFPIFQVTYPEQDIAMTANFDGGTGTGSCGNCNAASFALGATSGTVNGIAGNTNVDSLMLGSFSLNPSMMTMVFTPNTVGTGIPTSATMTYTNTTTGQDPNPDYVDQINLVFPGAGNVNPASITVPAGWSATQTSANNWRIALCATPTNATPCSTNETANAIAPGGQFQMTLNYPSAPYPTAGTYNVQWYVTGANGGENTSAITTTAPITFSATTASVAVTQINGNAVTAGSEPQVGTDTTANGNTYTFVVKNTGATNLDTVNITVPNTTRAGASGADSTGTYWTITTAPTVALSAGSSGTAGTCSGTLGGAQYASAAAAGNGKIALTGCTLVPGGTATITVTMRAPYTLSQDYLFNTYVKNGATQVNANPVYTAANAVAIILNGTLTILTPAVGWVAPTSPNSITPAAGSGATPSTSCVSCQVLAGSPATVDFGMFNGTFNATDIVDASVWSDANSPNSWVLYVSTSANPSNMLSAQVDNTHSSVAAGYTVNATTMALMTTTAPGTQLSTYNGTGRHAPLDSIMNFQIATGGNTAPQTVTLTYTLVFN